MPDYFRDQEPDAQSIIKLHDQLKKIWEGFHVKLEKIEAFLKGTTSIWAGPEFTDEDRKKRPTYRPPMARGTVDDAVDLMMAFDPKIHIEAQSDDEGSTFHSEKASAKENFASAVWEASGYDEPVIPAKQLSRNLVGRGYGNFEGPIWEDPPAPPRKRPGEDKETFKRREAQHESLAWNPIKIRAYNPTRVLMPPFEKQPSVAIKVSKFTNLEILDIAIRADGQYTYTGDDWDTKTVYELWTPDWHALVGKEGQLVFKELNPWGFVPYIHGFSGWGDEMAGEDGSDPQWLAAGLLESVMESLIWQARVRSGLNAIMMREAFQKVRTTKSEEEAKGLLAGNVLYDSEEKDWGWLQSQQASQNLFEQATWLDTQIEHGTMSSLLSGLRQPGANTVGQYALISYYGQKKFVAPGKQLGFMASTITQNLFRLLDLRNEVVTVLGKKLKPEDIDGIFAAKVTFESVDPVLQLEEKKFELAAMQAGVSDWWTYMEVARREDITEMFKRRVKHEFYFGESGKIVMASLVQAYAERSGQLELMTPPSGGLVDQFGKPLQTPQTTGPRSVAPLPGPLSPNEELVDRGFIPNA